MVCECDPVYDNVSPSDHVMAEFKPFMQNFWDRCYVVQQEILEAIVIGCHLDPVIPKNMHLRQVNEM